MLPIYLSEPSNEPARQRVAARLARQRPAPAPDASALTDDRERAASDLTALIARCEAALAERGIAVSHAATAAVAAERIAVLAAGLPVAVTRAAVLGELHTALAERGIAVVPTYGPGDAAFNPRRRRFWQLPPHAPAPSWSTRPLSLDDDGERRAVVGLFGVNAVSAASGAVYLLQHSANIGTLVRTAQRLVFVVAVDKIAVDDAAARRQVEAVGTYGADTVLLDLSRTHPLGDPLASLATAGGPPAVEVILLDNGRTNLRHGRYAPLLTCIGCRACATRCPTYPEFRGSRGWSPKDYLWSHLRGDNPSLDLCTLCGNCEVDCPVDIPLPVLIAGRRAEDIAANGRGVDGWRRRLHGQVEQLATAFSATAPLSNAAPRLPLAATVMDKVFGLAPQRRLPEFRRETFERWWKGRSQIDSPPLKKGGKGGFEEVDGGEIPPNPPFSKGGTGGGGPVSKEGIRRARSLVYYFGCFANYNDPDVGRAVVRILETLGYEVVLPEWRCCGIPLYAKGEVDAARRMVETNVAALSAHLDAGREVVTSCPSCHLALARDYPRLFPSAAADRVARHTHFLSRFLLDSGALDGRLAALPQRGEPPRGEPQYGEPQRAAYHLPCHLRALGMETDTVQLLARIPGLRVADVGRGCCGMSGTFGLERDHYAQSMDIGAGLFDAVRESKADWVLTDCGACKLQIEHGTARRVTHPLEVLSRALDAGAEAVPAPGHGVAA